MTNENRSPEVMVLTFAVGLIAAVLTAFFLYVGAVKVFGWPNPAMLENQTTRFFNVYGLTRPMVVMIGLTELFGALTVSFHRRHWIGLAGAAALFLVSTGALYFHLQYDRAGMVAFRTMILSAFVLVAGGGLYLRRVGALRIEEALAARRTDPVEQV